VMLFQTQLAFVYRLLCCSLWVEISTLTYVTNSNCWPERLSLAYCTHIIQTKIMHKNRRYPQKSMFSHRSASCSVGVICRGCEVVTCNTQPSIY
jgi:hypothetical protein